LLDLELSPKLFCAGLLILFCNYEEQMWPCHHIDLTALHETSLDPSLAKVNTWRLAESTD